MKKMNPGFPAAILTAVCLLLTMAACGESPSEPSDSASGTGTGSGTTATPPSSQTAAQQTQEPAVTLPAVVSGAHEGERFPGESATAADGSFGAGNFDYANDADWSLVYGDETEAK